MAPSTVDDGCVHVSAMAHVRGFIRSCMAHRVSQWLVGWVGERASERASVCTRTCMCARACVRVLVGTCVFGLVVGCNGASGGRRQASVTREIRAHGIDERTLGSP